MVERIMYQKIRFLKDKKFLISEIVKETQLDWKTVRKFMKMNEQEYIKYLEKVKHRTRCFEPYKAEIIERYALNRFRPLQKSSIFDYLEEMKGALPGTERALRDYIDYLVETGQLKISEGVRLYAAVPELPYGKQMQADFGEYRCKDGLKLHIFAAVLSASRYKYCAFQEKPFTTLDVIRHFLDCFRYFGGQPEELVIDQDRLMIVSENHGDIIYTKSFSAFKDEMGFDLYVCRKSDPESKGKVENLVKFVKKNFLDARNLLDIDEAQNSLRKWLVRRANGKVSAATKRVPASVFEEEKKHLKPLRSSIYLKESVPEKEERSVDKMCRISVNSRKYPVPEKYRNKEVEIYKTDERIFVYDMKSGVLVDEHIVPLLPGSVVSPKREPDAKKEKLDRLLEELLLMFPLKEWKEFVRRNREKFTRYFRDQYHEARRKFSKEISLVHLKEALEYCIENGTITMSELDDTYKYFKRENGKPEPAPVIKLLPESAKTLELINGLSVAKRDLSIYKSIVSSGREARP
ncbi:MAG: DDE-type integrase/transposase/recombinase [Candidatus Wallbacteria bacterium]|nr:DDE-type integrase/transposase/recombinase [Candidatus Wallbacteria bacterium]